MDKIIATATLVEPCHYSVVVTVPAARVAKITREIQGQFRQYAQVPGFRAGVAPDRLLKMRFGKQIAAESRDRLVKEGFQQLLEGEHKPATMPTFVKGQEGDLAEGKDFTFAVEYDTLPEIATPAYQGLALRKAKFSVSDEEIQRVLDDMARQRTTWAVVERPAATGDTVKVSYAATLGEGVTVPDAAKRLVEAEETWLQLAEPELIPGVTAQLAGQLAGAEVTFSVTFPEGYHEPTLVGKTAEYKFKLIEVHGSILPTIDDEFAKQMGTESLAALKTAISENLGQRYDQLTQNHLRGQVSEALMKDATFELPPRLLQFEESQSVQELLMREQQNENQRPPPKDEEEMKSRSEDLMKQAKEMAQQRLRYRLMVDHLAKVEKLTVTEEEVEQTLEAFLQSRNMTMAQFEKDRDIQATRSRLHDSLLRDKVESRVLELATVTEVDPAVMAAENAAAEASAEEVAAPAAEAPSQPAEGAAPSQA